MVVNQRRTYSAEFRLEALRLLEPIGKSATDPEVMAQAFFGMFFAYNISEILTPEPLAGGVNDEAVVEQFVDLYVNGTMRQA